jgi:hypothetical protein
VPSSNECQDLGPGLYTDVTVVPEGGEGVRLHGLILSAARWGTGYWVLVIVTSYWLLH